MKPVLSIVIVNWNAKDYLRKCLDSILGVGSSYPFEIIVVDNASSDGSYDMLKSEFSESRLIE